MLKMVTIECIRKARFREGKSIRRIAKELGVSRQSVRKAIAGEVQRAYTLSQGRPCSVMDPYRSLISEWLKCDDDARANSAIRPDGSTSDSLMIMGSLVPNPQFAHS